eukprot:2433925-Prymnesium_polylepis.1
MGTRQKGCCELTKSCFCGPAGRGRCTRMGKFVPCAPLRQVCGGRSARYDARRAERGTRGSHAATWCDSAAPRTGRGTGGRRCSP